MINYTNLYVTMCLAALACLTDHNCLNLLIYEIMQNSIARVKLSVHLIICEHTSTAIELYSGFTYEWELSYRSIIHIKPTSTP